MAISYDTWGGSWSRSGHDAWGNSWGVGGGLIASFEALTAVQPWVAAGDAEQPYFQAVAATQPWVAKGQSVFQP